MASKKITATNHSEDLRTPADAAIVRGKFYNELKDEVDAITDGGSEFDTISEKTAGSGVTVDGVLLKDGEVTTDTINEETAAAGVTIDGVKLKDGGVWLSDTVVQYTDDVLISSAEIVGTDAGDLGHASGVELVAAPGANYVLQFVNAVIIYDYDTAAYTDGAGDDLTIYQNSVAVSPAIATADLITKAGDTVINLSALAAADYVLGVNSNLNLACTAVTNPGTAAGVIRVKITYNVITHGL